MKSSFEARSSNARARQPATACSSDLAQYDSATRLHDATFAVVEGACRHHKAADIDSCLRLADEAEAKGVPLGRAGETLLVEAIMEAWQQRGRPADILQVAVARFEHTLLRHWPTQLKATGFKSRWHPLLLPGSARLLGLACTTGLC